MEDVAEVLASLIRVEAEAHMVLRHASFPLVQVPQFDRPLLFWEQVLGFAVDGMIPDTADPVSRILHAAWSLRPGNAQLTRLLQERDPNWSPATVPPPPEGMVAAAGERAVDPVATGTGPELVPGPVPPDRTWWRAVLIVALLIVALLVVCVGIASRKEPPPEPQPSAEVTPRPSVQPLPAAAILWFHLTVTKNKVIVADGEKLEPGELDALTDRVWNPQSALDPADLQDLEDARRGKTIRTYAKMYVSSLFEAGTAPAATGWPAPEDGVVVAFQLEKAGRSAKLNLAGHSACRRVSGGESLHVKALWPAVPPQAAPRRLVLFFYPRGSETPE